MEQVYGTKILSGRVPRITIFYNDWHKKKHKLSHATLIASFVGVEIPIYMNNK